MQCARIWPKFKMFHKFEQETLLLQETIIEQFEDIYVGNQYTDKINNDKAKKNQTIHPIYLQVRNE